MGLGVTGCKQASSEMGLGFTGCKRASSERVVAET